MRALLKAFPDIGLKPSKFSSLPSKLTKYNNTTIQHITKQKKERREEKRREEKRS